MAVRFEAIRKTALSLGHVVESPSYGATAFKAACKLLARLREDRDSPIVGTTFEEREPMMSEEPKASYTAEHYRNYPWVLVRLSPENGEGVRDRLSGALRIVFAKPKRASGRRVAARIRWSGVQ